MTEADAGKGLPEAEFAELLQTVGAVAPLLKGVLGAARPPDPAPPPHDRAEGDGSDAHRRRREALLVSLKPYLSPARCRAVVYSGAVFLFRLLFFETSASSVTTEAPSYACAPLSASRYL